MATLPTLNQLLAAGILTELNYMPADEATAARALEAELLADATAGVDLRARLVAAAVSPSTDTTDMEDK